MGDQGYSKPQGRSAFVQVFEKRLQVEQLLQLETLWRLFSGGVEAPAEYWYWKAELHRAEVGEEQFPHLRLPQQRLMRISESRQVLLSEQLQASYCHLKIHLSYLIMECAM